MIPFPTFAEERSASQILSFGRTSFMHEYSVDVAEWLDEDLRNADRWRMAKTVREIAEQLVAARSRRSDQSEPPSATASDFAPLDRRAYDRFLTQLRGAGYQFVADYLVVDTYEEVGARHWPIVVRCMVSADGAVCANYQQIRPMLARNLIFLATRALRVGIRRASIGKLRRYFVTEHVYDFESETGATFLGTSTAVDASAFTAPPEVSMQFLPRGTDHASVRIAHESRVRAATLEGKGPPTRMTNLREVQAMEGRCAEAKFAYRATIGWVTLEELYRLVPANRAMAESIYREVELINRGA